MRFTKAVVALAALAFLTVAAPAKAAVIAIGDTISIGYVFPNLGTYFNAPQNVLIGAGVELIGYPVGDPRTNIDFGNDSIAIDFQSASTWTASSFNGIEITGFTGLGSVILNTNMVGLDLGDFTIADNLLRINWAGLPFTANTFVNLTLVSVPEPASLLLFGTALAGVGARALRRRSRR